MSIFKSFGFFWVYNFMVFLLPFLSPPIPLEQLVHVYGTAYPSLRRICSGGLCACSSIAQDASKGLAKFAMFMRHYDDKRRQR